MTREEFDHRFSQYRQHLGEEVARLHSYASVFLGIQERKTDYLEEINLAPAFFQVTESALFSGIILWIHKLLDEKGQRGLFDFLDFVRRHRRWLTVEELQRRGGYNDGHWCLAGREEVTAESIDEDRQRLRGLAGLASIRRRRDKFHGHFDRVYFFDREEIGRDAPILRPELEGILATIGEVLNSYSADFDGVMRSWRHLNIGDLEVLLGSARRGRLAGG